MDLSNIDLSTMNLAEKAQLLELLEAKDRAMRENQLAHFKPYPKQKEFFAAGGDPNNRERLLMAGNQLGKTLGAGFETACHLTGRYPDWWDGKRFEAPVTGWAASLTSQGTRDTVQRILLGPPGQWGTGMIPKECIVEIKRAAHGVPDAVETIVVRYKSGGLSYLTLKTYDQGRERWQGATLDFVWFDEEPNDISLYAEGLTRTNAGGQGVGGGCVYMTFTPLLGMSKVVKRYLIEKAPGTHVTQMTIMDALHYTPEQRERIIAAYPEHERKARADGIPMMGSGAVFPVAEEMITVEPFSIPEHWPRIAGIDFGWSHPFAASWIAIDPDSDVYYIYDCYRQSEATPAIHAAAMRGRGQWIPISWPHDGMQHDKGSGITLAQQYKTAGLNMLAAKATWPDGSNSVEAGLLEMLDRMQTGRLKVFRHLADWFEEFRMYHRKDGRLVKEGDDLLSSTRYAIMMARFARTNMHLKRIQQAQVTHVIFDQEAGY